MLAPAPVSDVYSDVDMRIHLAVAPGNNTPCLGVECLLNHDFDQQVQQLGARLAKAAFDSYPELSKRVSRFEFVVAEKEEFGSASNATGTVVIFRGVQKLYLDEEALAFLIAREMGHVIGHHHDENLAPTIILSVATAVLFPAIGIFKGASLLAGTTSAAAETTAMTSIATTAASSATSYIGSRAILANLRPDQLSEADVIAVGLLADIGCDKRKVAIALESCTQAEGKDDWVEDYHISVKHVKALAAQAEPIDLQVAQDVPHDVDEPAATGIDAMSEPREIIEPEEMQLHDEPRQFAGEQNKPPAEERVAKAGTITANAHQEETHSDDAGIVAGNDEASGSSDIAAKIDANGRELTDMKQDYSSADRADAEVPTVPLLPGGAHGHPAKAVVRTVSATKTASSNREGSRAVSRKAGIKASSPAVAAKQENIAKAHTSKRSKVAQGAGIGHKAKSGHKSALARSSGTTSGQGKVKSLSRRVATRF